MQIEIKPITKEEVHATLDFLAADHAERNSGLMLELGLNGQVFTRRIRWDIQVNPKTVDGALVFTLVHQGPLMLVFDSISIFFNGRQMVSSTIKPKLVMVSGESAQFVRGLRVHV